MDKLIAARILDEISRYLELSDANPFKSKAFAKASRAVENIEGDLAEFVSGGELKGVPGIGKATSEVIVEIARTGRSSYLEELRAQYPPGIFDLQRVPKLGIRKIGQLHSELGIGTLDELEAAARDGRLAALRGFGTATARQVLEGIGLARMRESRFLLPVGLSIGESLRESLSQLPVVDEVEVSGSVRRRLEVIRNVNLVVATKKPLILEGELSSLASNLQNLDARTWKGTVRNEMDVLFHIVSPAEFGTELLRTTGGAAFIEAFEAASGSLPKAKSEKDLFRKLDVPYVEPERRESGDDLKRRKRTRLVDVGDLRGTFHVHSTFSDGRNTIAEMLAAARVREWEYVGISDHSPAAHYAGGLSEQRLAEQHAEIRRHEPALVPMRVFRGTEADILRDGSIDYGARVLSRLDFVVASVHSSFTMSRDEMTARILRALDDPHVTFLGHLTGRKLLSREGYSIDYDAIFERAAERGVMIEINGNPNRLDVDWRHLRRAADLGVTFSIHPDAHSVAEYNAVVTGTWVARKGGLSPKQIFNTRGVDEVAEALAKRRGAGQLKT